MELEVKIKNENLDLAASGIVLLDGSKSTTFTIIDDGQPLDMIFRFINDDTNSKEVRRETRLLIDRNAFEIDFINYNSVLGSFTKEPWLIGTSFKRKLYLAYLISSLTDSTMKKFEYSFYLGEEENNG